MALTLCSAGAGSGKTYRLCEEIAARVLAGLDPAHILATTFTRKAASELRERIEARLLAADELPINQRVALVERLDLAAIGTVHSVAQRLIHMHAIALGVSPNLEVIEETARNRHLNEMLRQEDWDGAEPLEQLAVQFSVEKLSDLLLGLLERKRSNGIPSAELREQLLAELQPWIDALAGDAAIDEVRGIDGLVAVGNEVLVDLQVCVLEHKAVGTTKVAERLADLVGDPNPSWQAFAVGALYAAGKKDGGQEAMLPLMKAVAESVRWTGLHAAMRKFVGLVADRVVQLDTAWEAYKRARGLFDFADLELWLLRLLEDPEISQDVASRFRLVVVDEFQDTSPIQLAIFLRLQALTDDSFWVGDDKQAIYGFRGADVGLVRAAWGAAADAKRDNLPASWRSQAGLVRFVNQIFGEVLPEVALEPTKPVAPDAVEWWQLEATRVADQAACLAQGVRALLAEGRRASEIAILTRTNPGAAAVAQTLKDAGIPRRLALPGLMNAREVAAAIAGLRIIADRDDTLAAATLLSLLGAASDGTPDWLANRLRHLQAGEPRAWDSGLVQRLSEISGARLTPSGAVDAVVAILDLGALVATWTDPLVRLGRLDELRQFAVAYEEEMRQQGGGATLSGLVTWLNRLQADENDAEPIAGDADAVRVLTVHSAKGLEWPVVILTELDKVYGPQISTPAIRGGATADGKPLLGRRLRWWPDPFGGGNGTDALFLQTEAGQRAAQSEADSHVRLMYVAMTRAKDKLVLTIPANATKMPQALECVPALADLAPVGLAPGSYPLGATGSTLLVRRLAPPEAVAPEHVDAVQWLMPRTVGTAVAPLALQSPSKVAADASAHVDGTMEPLPGPPAFATRAQVEERSDYGDAVHAYFATLPATRGVDTAVRVKTADGCIAGFGMVQHLNAAELVAAGERFVAWCDARFPDGKLHTEVAVTGLRNDGGLWHGTIDALVELADGRVVVIDHKTAGVAAGAGAVAVAKHYAGQLGAYAEALTAAGARVAETWVHLPVGGVCCRVG